MLLIASSTVAAGKCWALHDVPAFGLGEKYGGKGLAHGQPCGHRSETQWRNALLEEHAQPRLRKVMVVRDHAGDAELVAEHDARAIDKGPLLVLSRSEEPECLIPSCSSCGKHRRERRGPKIVGNRRRGSSKRAACGHAQKLGEHPVAREHGCAIIGERVEERGRGIVMCIIGVEHGEQAMGVEEHARTLARPSTHARRPLLRLAAVVGALRFDAARRGFDARFGVPYA